MTLLEDIQAHRDSRFMSQEPSNFQQKMSAIPPFELLFSKNDAKWE